MGSLCLWTLYVFTDVWHPYVAIKYLVIPFIMWGAFRFGPAGATLTSLVSGLLATWLTVHGCSEFAVVGLSDRDQVLALELYVSFIALIGLFMAAILAERERAKAALAESEVRYHTLFEQAGDHVFLLDFEPAIPVILDMNYAALQAHGYSRAEIVGKPITIIDPDAEFRTREDRLKLLNTEPLELFNTRHLRKNGTWFTVEVHFRTIELSGKALILSVERDITERKLAEEALHEMAHRLLEVGDMERRRLARELHDSTAQKVAGLLMILGRVESAGSGEKNNLHSLLQDAQDLAGKCAQELRTISHLLHPPLLEELGLEVALDAYLAGFTKRSGIAVRLELPENLGRLDSALELALFRVVQESLGNIHRHSGSLTARVQLTKVKDRLVLEIRDDGRGIAAERLRELREHASAFGVGITGMQQRLRQLGGELEIDSSSSGTAVLAIVPLHKKSS